MLKRFFVNNFKSLLNVEFRPAGINLLVGPNNAGKTNLCAALRFIAGSSQHTLDAALLGAIGERWNITNFHVPQSKEIAFDLTGELSYRGEPLQLTYELRLESVSATLRGEKTDAESLRVVEEKLKATGGRFADTLLLENRGGVVRMLHEEGFANRHPNSPLYIDAKIASNATMLSQLYELESNPRAILFRKYLRSWAYYNFNPDALRLPDVAREDGSLLPNGGNLSRVLYELHNEKPRLERKLIDALRKLEPKLDLFSFSAPDPEHVHLFGEDDKGHRFSTRSMS